MLPVSTPPNAVIYGTGYVGAGELRRTGISFDLVGVGLVVLYFGFL
jgi:sodium-dependent dicarboxylate transporter 2/3/5